MKQYAFRLRRGDDLLASLRDFAREQGIEAAYVGCCVGCVSKARLRDASGVTIRALNEPMEIVSLTGTVSKSRCHVHISFSKKDLSTVGGHLVEGCEINTTAEIVLCELQDLQFDRVFDPVTGYDELEILPARQAPIKAPPAN